MNLLKELVSLNEAIVWGNYKSKDKIKTAKHTYDTNKGMHTVKFFKNGKPSGKDYVTDGEYDAIETANAYVDAVDNPDLSKSAKEHLKTLKESSGDYSTEEHAIAAVIKEKLEKLTNKETSGRVKLTTKHPDLLKGVVKFQIEDAEKGDGTVYDGTITVKINWKKPRFDEDFKRPVSSK
jgi:hypothetical protein